MNKVFTSNPEKNMGFLQVNPLTGKKKARLSKFIVTQVRGGSEG